MDHPEVPESIGVSHRRVEHGVHLWDGPRSPKTDFVERTFPSWPAEMQEKHFAEAVLLAARGVPSVLAGPVPQDQEGNLRGREYPPLLWLTSELVDDTLGKYAEPVLGLAADRAIVWRFGKEHTMSYHDGLINQAFGAALVGVCLELHEFICTVWDEVQVSRAPLSVVHTRLSPYAPLFSLLRDLLDSHQGKCGCAVLKLLESARARYIGYPVGEIALGALLDQACRPFFDILGAWIYEGANVAPWEFPLARTGGNFMSWELAPSGLPVFLQGSATQVLQCGKLALILKEAGVAYHPQRGTLQYHPDGARNAELIGKAFQHANMQVLKLLRADHKLLARVDFLHRFILCGSGDWVSAFMDHCWQHQNCALDRAVRDTRWDELQRAMRNACDSSAGSKFPREWVEALRVEPASKSLIRMVRRMARMQQEGFVANATDDEMRLGMEVIQAIQMNTTLEWPVSLVVHQTALSKYQLLGRLVLRVKGLLYSLHRFRRRRGARMSGAHAASFREMCALRGAMIHFLTNLETYLLYEVIDPAFLKLKSKIASAETVDAILEAHDTFTDTCIVSAMATSEGLYKRIEMVFLTIRLFASSLQTIDNTDKHEIEACKRFRKLYRERLGELLKEMQASSAGKGESEMQPLRHMLGKLDFNKYYLRQGLYSEGV